jgi:hypothetical protein
MPINNIFATNALVKLVIVVIVVGSLMGLAFAGTDLFNPHTSRAKANEMNQDTEYQYQRDAIDLEYYEQERAIQLALQRQQLEFQRQRDRQQLAHQRERDARALAFMPIRDGIILGMGSLVLLAACGGLTFQFISLGRKPRHVQRDPWQSPEFRQSRRLLAQANEQWLRYLELSQQPSTEAVTIGGDGHHREPARSDG